MKKLLLLLALCSAPLHAAELSTYPSLNLAKVAGVDSGNNVGLMTPAALYASAAATLPNASLISVFGFESGGTVPAATPVTPLGCIFSTSTTYSPSPALYFNSVSNVIGCSLNVQLTNTSLSIAPAGILTFPDGGFYNSAGLNVAALTTMTGGLRMASPFGKSLGVEVLTPYVAVGALGAGLLIGPTESNYVNISYIFTSNGSTSNKACILFNATSGSTCTFGFTAGGFLNFPFAQLSAGAGFPALSFTTCGNFCGLLTPAASQFQFGVGTSSFSPVWDYGVTSAGNFSFKVPLGLKGYTVSTLPTGVQGQTAFVTDATACTYGGALTGGSTTFCKVVYTGAAWLGG